MSGVIPDLFCYVLIINVSITIFDAVGKFTRSGSQLKNFLQLYRTDVINDNDA